MTIGPEPMISILCMSLRFGTAFLSVNWWHGFYTRDSSAEAAALQALEQFFTAKSSSCQLLLLILLNSGCFNTYEKNYSNVRF